MLALILFLLLISPIRLTLTLDNGFTVDLRLWGFGRGWQPVLSSGQGNTSRQQLLRMVGTVLRTNHARRFLCKHITLVKLQAMLHLSLADAANTALATGMLRQIASLLPANADVRIHPDFLHASSRLQARCILFFHLGTIVIAAGMVLLAWLLERREHENVRGSEYYK